MKDIIYDNYLFIQYLLDILNGCFRFLHIMATNDNAI